MSKNNNQQNQQKRGDNPALQIMDEAPFVAESVKSPAEMLDASKLNTEQQPLADGVKEALNETIPAQLGGVLDTVNAVKEEASQESLQPTAPVVEQKPTIVEPVAPKAPEEEPAKVDPKQARIDTFVAPFRKYAERMDAGVPNDQASTIRNQRDLFRAFRNLLNVDDAQVFGPAFKEVLTIWHGGQDGAFNANIRLYRQIDNLQLSPQENLEFNTLLRLMDAIHDPAKRQANLLQIDLNRALPEIGGIDARGYLAGFVRRF